MGKNKKPKLSKKKKTTGERVDLLQEMEGCSQGLAAPSQSTINKELLDIVILLWQEVRSLQQKFAPAPLAPTTPLHGHVANNSSTGTPSADCTALFPQVAATVGSARNSVGNSVAAVQHLFD